MLLSHFGLREDPFGVTPDSRYFFETQVHREALASLIYGISVGRGFMALIAQPGMGKTSILNRLLQELGQNTRTAYLFQTQCNSREFLGYLLTDLELLDSSTDVVTMHRRLNELLVQEAKSGKKCIAVIDEAQNLDHEVLETVRLLSDFETGDRKLLQIILAGQPALAEKLADPRQEQLRQRISTISWLTPLSGDEVAGYIEYRLHNAGYRGPKLFSADSVQLIANGSKGIPRTINNICFNALSICCAENGRQVERRMIEEVVRDLNLREPTADHHLGEVEKTIPVPVPTPAPSTVNAVGSAGWGTGVQTARPTAHSSSTAATAFSKQATAPKLYPEPSPLKLATESPRPRLVQRAPSVKRSWWEHPSVGARRALAVALVSGCAALAGVGIFSAWQASRSTRQDDQVRLTSVVPGDGNREQSRGTQPSTTVSADSAPAVPSKSVLRERSSGVADEQGERNARAETASRSQSERRAALEPSMGSFSRNPVEATPISPPQLDASTKSLNGIAPLASAPATIPSYRPVPRPPETPSAHKEEPGFLLTKVMPTYPKAAQSAHIAGTVELEVIVGTDGSVRDVRVLSGPLMLRQAATDAVRKWRYQPYRVDGAPTEFATHITVKFTLGNAQS